MECPGSVALTRGIESEDSAYSREGTFAHMVAALCLQDGKDAAAMIGFRSEEFAVDAEMAEHIQVYLDAVRSVLMIDGGTLLIEVKVKVTDDIYGTADAIVVSDDTIHVFDLKYGRGVFVDADDNPQTLTYGLGAVLGAVKLTATQAKLHIVQPRCNAERLWRTAHTTTAFLTGEWHPKLLAAAAATKQPDAPLSPGDHCGFCQAKPFCPALRKQALTTAQSVFSNLDLTVQPVKPPSPANLSPEQIATVLKGADLVKTWIKGVEDMAFDMLKKGTEVPGFKLVEKRGNRKWRDEAEAERELANTGADPYAPREVVSPAQAEKLLAKKMSRGNAEALVERLAHKPVTGSTIVLSSDPRPALLPGAAFSVIEET